MPLVLQCCRTHFNGNPRVLPLPRHSHLPGSWLAGCEVCVRTKQVTYLSNHPGLSETSGPATIAIPRLLITGNVGNVFPGTECRIVNPDATGEGEICFRGRHRFAGYLHNPEGESSLTVLMFALRFLNFFRDSEVDWHRGLAPHRRSWQDGRSCFPFSYW